MHVYRIKVKNCIGFYYLQHKKEFTTKQLESMFLDAVEKSAYWSRNKNLCGKVEAACKYLDTHAGFEPVSIVDAYLSDADIKVIHDDRIAKLKRKKKAYTKTT